MSEIVGTLARSKTGEEGSDRSLEVRNGSCGNFAKEILKTAEGHLDRIEIRRVFGQIAQRCASPLNDGADGGAHMDGAVIHDDNVIAPQRRNQALLDISQEEFGGHGPLNHHWSRHLVATQGANESQRLPRSKWNRTDHSDALWSTASQPCQVGADRSFVKKYQPRWIKPPLISYPAPACSRDVGPLPFGGLQAFF